MKHKVMKRELYGYDGMFEKICKSFQIMLQNGMTYFTKKRYKDIIKSELNVFANILEIIHFWEKGHISFDVTIRNYLNYNKNVVLNLKNVELEMVDLEEFDLRKINFSHANLKGAN